MTISANIIYEGSLVDICDSIVSVSGFSRAFSGELIRFKSSVVEIYGFVLNLEYSVCKIPLISGSQTSLSIGDLVFSTKKLVNTRCGFGVLGEVISPIGEFLIDSEIKYHETVLTRLFKTK